MTAKATGPFPGFYQFGYVTNDFDRAVAQFARTHGIGSFLQMREMQYETGPGRAAICHLGLAMSGATEIEIIAPLDGDVGIYREILPASGFALRFHHASRIIADEAAFDAELERHRRDGRPLPIVGGAKGSTRYFYADFRPELGHYVENIVFGPDTQAMMDAMPRY
ncbi:MAG: VOC family protein [Gammaproteobacteria bacterium]